MDEMQPRDLVIRCYEACKAHKRVCNLEPHMSGPHYCSACPWPASSRMVRRGSR